MDFVEPKLDVMFKMIMTSNKNILRSFIAAMLDMPVNSIRKVKLLDPKIVPTNKDDKKPELDLRLLVRNKGDEHDTIVDVEVQLYDHKAFIERSLYYWARLYSDQLNKSDEYDKLRKTICINILDFKLFNDVSSPYSEFYIMEKDRLTRLTDRFSMRFCELPKIDETIDPNDPKKLWLQFLNADSEEELNMLIKTGIRSIKDAIVTLREKSSDEFNRSVIEQRRKEIRERKARDAFVREEGIAMGETKERAEMVAAMRQLGATEEFIDQVLKTAGGDV